MERVDKLREFIGEHFIPTIGRYEIGMTIADEIEREISEHYILAPLDVDGVPIHVGDLLVEANRQVDYKIMVGKILYDGKHWHIVDAETKLAIFACDMRHSVNESTITDYAEHIRKAVES